MEATFPSSTTVTLTAAGVYRIDYRILVGTAEVPPAVTPSIELELNGAAVPSSALLLASAAEVAGVAVVSTTAGTTVALRVTGSNINLPTGTNAFLDIIKIA